MGSGGLTFQIIQIAIEEAVITRVSNAKPIKDKQGTLRKEDLVWDVRKYTTLHWKAGFKSPSGQKYTGDTNGCFLLLQPLNCLLENASSTPMHFTSNEYLLTGLLPSTVLGAVNTHNCPVNCVFMSPVMDEEIESQRSLRWLGQTHHPPPWNKPGKHCYSFVS